ncbi:uncharacterized protein [Polyergus mexicanus]|uniref:uncharacterized protein n=1 Tax=Polyergus mexicanus TaxID=615972 RepID=UPI0038B56594
MPVDEFSTSNPSTSTSVPSAGEHHPRLTNPTQSFPKSEFLVFKIRADDVKYSSVIQHLNEQALLAIAELIENPPEKDKYLHVKNILINRFTDSEEKRLRQLLAGVELNDKKPSDLLRKIKQLVGGAISENVLHSIWLQRLPSQVQAILAVVEDCPLIKLAELADKILDRETSLQVATIASPVEENTSNFTNLERRIAALEIKRVRRADISLIPKRFVSKVQVISSKLYAANGTKINTYVDIKNKKLLDSVTGLSFKGKLSKVNHLSICTTFPDSPFHKILAEFPELTHFAPISTNKIHQIEHHIITKGPPIASTPRRLSPEKLKFARDEFNFMVEQGMCRPSSNTWTAPLHMVPKNGPNSWRLCGDYRALNEATVPDRYPLPHIQDFTAGLHVSKQGIKPTSEKVKAIIDYKKPKTIHELRRFIGIINFYHRCLKNAASHQAVLTDYLKDSRKRDKRLVTWTSEAEEALKNCKEELLRVTTLAHPAPTVPLILTCDASDFAVGASLEQKLDDTQRNYSTYDRELLGIYLAIKHFRFSRWPEAIPLTEISADTVSTAFYTHWVARYGAPQTITTDQGPQFEAALFKALTNLISCERIRTSAYHPASNGILERWHRTLKSAIICHANENWFEILPTVLLGLRTCFKEDLNASPAEMLYGSTLRIPEEFFNEEDLPSDPEFFIEKHRIHMREIKSRPTAHHHKKTLFFHKNLYDCTHVWIREDAVRKSLQPPYSGPFRKIVNITTERLKPAFLPKEISDDVIVMTSPSSSNSPQSTFLEKQIKTYSGPRKKVWIDVDIMLKELMKLLLFFIQMLIEKFQNHTLQYVIKILKLCKKLILWILMLNHGYIHCFIHMVLKDGIVI